MRTVKAALIGLALWAAGCLGGCGQDMPTLPEIRQVTDLTADRLDSAVDATRKALLDFGPAVASACFAFPSPKCTAALGLLKEAEEKTDKAASMVDLYRSGAATFDQASKAVEESSSALRDLIKVVRTL